MSFFLAVFAITLLPFAIMGGRGAPLIVPVAAITLIMQVLAFRSVLQMRQHRRRQGNGPLWFSIVGMAAATAAMILATYADGGC